jgi:uncharacterized protein YacL
MIFKNISDFNKVSDYLPIFNGIITIELVGIYLTLRGYIDSSVLREWYMRYGIVAVMADVLIIFIGFIIARYIYRFFFSKFNLLYFIFLFLVVQIVHDICFYVYFTNVPKGKNAMLDLFKRYAKELKQWSIAGDSFMVVTSAIVASSLAGFSLNFNIIYLITTLYFLPYTLSVTK